MKEKVLLFGSTGNLGQFVFWELVQQNYDVTVVVRDKVKAVELFSYWANILDLDNESVLTLPQDVFASFDVVISLLGNRISHLNTIAETGGSDFFEVNEKILLNSVKTKVKKFGIVAPYNEKKFINQIYFRKHQQFQEKIVSSGINYTIINTTLLFSSLTRQLKLAKNGKNIIIGEGKSKVNPIFDGDVATFLVKGLLTDKMILDCGGPEIFTRFELAQKLQSFVNGKYNIKRINPLSIPTILPIIKVRNPIMYNRLAYFYYVNRHDFICTPMGETTLQNYLYNHHGEKLKNYDRMRLLQNPVYSN
jgi:nucleoside-diphosphate-sugar epimerase